MMPLKQKKFFGLALLAFCLLFISAFTNAFQTSRSKDPWSKYKEYYSDYVPDATYSNVAPLPSGPETELGPLSAYRTSPKEDPLTIALKADDMITSFSNALVHLGTHSSILANRLPEYLMDKADQLSRWAIDMYSDVHDMYTESGRMKEELKENYHKFNGSDKSSRDSEELNSQSDDMAGRVGAMHNSIKGMSQQVRTGSDTINEMYGGLDEMAQNGRRTQEYYGRLIDRIRNASSQFEEMAKQLKDQGLDAPNTFARARQFFSDFQKYVEAYKPYTKEEINYINEVKRYLQKNQDFLNKTAGNLDETEKNLGDLEEYFHKAKVKPVSEEATPPLELPELKGSGGACGSLKSDDPNAGKGKPLMSQEQCQKTCHTVCRQEKKAGGSWCFACPSGSPDSCYNHNAIPADASWCKPGGVCYQDPELYCQDFGVIGDNKELLNCTNCKQAMDECWEKIPNTTNLTHCVQWCHDGVCTYKGKYKLRDKPPKFMHCYECKKIPVPTCESLGWGYSSLEMCMKNCPDGECKQNKITVGPDGKPVVEPPNAPPPNGGNGGGENGGQNGGECGGAGQCGNGQNGQNGGTQTGGGATGGDQGSQPNPPPTDKPLGGGEGSGGGANATAGGGKTPGEPGKTVEPGKTAEPGKSTSGDQKPPQEPKTTEPKQPPAPNTQDKPKLPDNPTTTPPDDYNVKFYTRMLEETKKDIEKHEDIINNPNEGELVKSMVRETLKTDNERKKDFEDKLKKARDEFNTQQKNYEDTKKYFENYYKTLPKKPSYAEEAKRRGEMWNLGKLKEATDNLKTLLKDAKESAENRKKRIDDMTREITTLENENQHFKDAMTEGRIDEDFAKTRIKENEKRIEELKKDRSTYIKAFQKSQEKIREDIEKAKSEYRTALWRVDDKARHKADVERIDEYYNLTYDLKRRKQAQDERNKVFDTIVKNLENARDDAKTRGDSSKADELQTQIDNLKRGQDKWNKMQDSQQENIKEQIRDLERRNFNEGAGPSSEQDLNDKLGRYSSYIQDKLKDPTLTDDQKAVVQATLDGIKDKQSSLASTELNTADKQTIDNTATMMANSFMSQDADKSFLRLAGESLVEEAVNNLNPLVAAKKSLAFGWGVVQGVGSAVKGVVELGAGATKLIVQSAASDIGLEGVFGTDAIDSLSNVLTTAYDNANPDGLLKAVMAAGAMQDKWLNDLQKSKDIDWATANAGGNVAGNIIAGELMAPGKAGELMTEAKALAQGEEVAAQAANVATKTGELAGTLTKAEETANTASKVEQTGSKAAEEAATTKAPEPSTEGATQPTQTKTPQASNAEPTQARAPPVENPAPTPAPSTTPNTVAPNTDLSFTQDGKTVNLKTGEELGHGSTSTAYVDANDPNKVIRVTNTGTASKVPEAAKLDDAGRKAVESIQKPDGPIRVVNKGEKYVVNDPNSPLNGKVVEVNERVQGGSADKMLAKQGGQMTQGQAEAFDQATRELNKNGYAWMDNHTGNYGFEKVPGADDKWKVVVIDPGGIVPMQGSTLAEKAENAIAFQQRINVPEEGTADFLNMMKARGPDAVKNAAMMEQGSMMEQFAGKIDASAMGLNSPYDIAFYPYGTADFPNVQALGKMSPEEAAAYYAGKK